MATCRPAMPSFSTSCPPSTAEQARATSSQHLLSFLPRRATWPAASEGRRPSSSETVATGNSSHLRQAVQMSESEAPAPAPTPTSAALAAAAPPASPSLPDDEDILRMILLRLPPLPSSLPRASLVSKLWRRVVSDPGFRRRFRAHHKTPPLLGFFFHNFNLQRSWHVFTPTLAASDRIPPARFACPSKGSLLGCRHGLALLEAGSTAVVWDPITGRRSSVDFPPELTLNRNVTVYHGAVLGDPAGSGGFRFRLIMVSYRVFQGTLRASIYDSDSGNWGQIISTAAFSDCFKPGVLVGSKLYWLIRHRSGGFLELDVDRRSLAVIRLSEDIPVPEGAHVQALRTRDGGLGVAVVAKRRMQLWGSTAISGDVVRAVLQKTVDLEQLLSLPLPSTNAHESSVVGYDEDTNTIFVWTSVGVFMIQLESMEFTKVSEDTCIRGYYPFASFYTPGN
ncbi:uncharacterized protein LOC120677837 [Panicum virgatum]|uniref:uncharacterized protein LOC120677837 n=1 Tax=Panicum virgatum TaxID=38727 RepID=UPI0019D56835|nr:uncharacterized protein LOC120677837 [Panicum virgatum]